MTLVAGVDSSTQSCRVLIVDAENGRIVRSGVAKHPDGTEIEPLHWLTALKEAITAAGELSDVAALSVGGQQHGMVCLDAAGEVIRPALLWNDTRSAQSAADLIVELGDGDVAVGARTWATATGSVPVASYTITKLRWLADHEPENASRIAAVCLPHDWLTWKLSGSASLETLVTDRSDASGTGYFDSVSNRYRRDLLALALRRESADDIVLPRVLGPHDVAGHGDGTLLPRAGVLGPGCGDNAGAALGLALSSGQTSISLGTSGVVAAVSDTPTSDASGLVSGFADATGRWLPLACTLNGSRVLDATARFLGVDHDEFASLALAGEPGAGGLTLVPWFEGERTPNLPTARASVHGITLSNLSRENYARAAVEGLICLMAGGVDAVRHLGVEVDSVTMIGGASRSRAVQQVAPDLLGVPVEVPEPGEYVAMGAARQAAWVLTGDLPSWPVATMATPAASGTGEAGVLERYQELSDLVADQYR